MGDRQTLRVGNGAGFWGDQLDAPVDLARSGSIDVLTLEYLAELTLAILAHLKSRDPSAGFVTDLPVLLPRLVPYLREDAGLRIVTNAGGLNPRSLAVVCGSLLLSEGLGDLPIGVVTGDDVLDEVPTLRASGVNLAHFETGEPVEPIAGRLVCANAYLGARPIAQALEDGAQIVLTGRVADASLTLGPVAEYFSWKWDDWDRLAGASVAGHLIECGAQATGGLWHQWQEVPGLSQIGYPIAEIEENGACVITKPAGTGGLVTVPNLTEQLVYEIDDPMRYRTPDVDVDLTTVELQQESVDRVRVEGARGRAPSERLKLSAVYRDGWTASGLLVVVGRDAVAKARAAGNLVLERVKRAGFDLEQRRIECLGAGDAAPGVIPPAGPVTEVVLRVTVRDSRREAIERFTREIAPLITAGPPGLAGYATGRPEVRPAFGYWSALIPEERVKAIVDVRPARGWARTGEARS